MGEENHITHNITKMKEKLGNSESEDTLESVLKDVLAQLVVLGTKLDSVITAIEGI